MDVKRDRLLAAALRDSMLALLAAGLVMIVCINVQYSLVTIIIDF